jgi:PAS domain S-box-containing protein
MQKSIVRSSFPWNSLFRLFCLCGIGLALLTSIHTSAHAKTLKIGIYENKPLVFQDAQGQVQGLSIDVLHYIAQQEDWQLEFVPGTWSDCLKRLEQGEIDLQVSIAVSDQRKKIYSYPKQTLITNWGRLYSHPKANIESLLDIDGKQVAMLEKDIHTKFFTSMMEKFNQKFQPVFVKSYEDVLESVQTNVATVGIVNRMYAMQNAHHFDVKTTPMIFNPIEVRYAAPKDSDLSVLQALDYHISELRENKSSIYYQSLEKWFGKTETHPLPAWLKTTLALVITASILILVITIFLKKKVASKTAEIAHVNTQLKEQIDQLKQAQRALKESEKKYRTVLDQQQDALLLHKYIPDGFAKYSDVNDTAVRFYGYTRGQLLNLTSRDIVAPEVKGEHFSKKNKELLLQNGHLVRESVHVKRAGERVPVEVSTSVVEMSGEMYLLSVIRDITERKAAERERIKLEEQIRQKFKMEAVGAMAGGVAHNFNNSLAIILGNLEMAKRRSSDPDKVRQYLDNAQKAILLSRDLVQQILTYSRKGSHKKITIKLSTMVDDVLNLLRSTIPSTIKLEFSTSDQYQSSMILADPSQIHEVVLNLCANAAHAMNEKGILTISVTEIDLDVTDIPAQYNCLPGRYSQLSVQDNGCGMSKETLDKIFDPFFTTKSINEGTGMGLSTVLGIVEQHNGLIQVQSSPKEGTIFKLFFPITESEVKSQLLEEDNMPETGTEKILLVDDEKMLLGLGKEILSTLGYQVTTEENSIEALNIVKKDINRFDLIITDQTMPGLSGKELAQEINSLNPNIPIIICSGFSTQVSEEDTGQFGISAYCSKPLRIAELSQVIKKSLAQKQS